MDMNIEIRKLTPDLAEDYIHFLIQRHMMTMWMLTNVIVYAGVMKIVKVKTFPQQRKRRKLALQYVKGNNIQGYLAYNGDKIIGWCNANTKSDCLKCVSWRRQMNYVPIEDSYTGLKVKSVFCFTIARK